MSRLLFRSFESDRKFCNIKYFRFQKFAYGPLVCVDYKSPPKERNCNQLEMKAEKNGFHKKLSNFVRLFCLTINKRLQTLHRMMMLLLAGRKYALKKEKQPRNFRLKGTVVYHKIC